MNPCACGCGQITSSPRARFRSGHNQRVTPRPPPNPGRCIGCGRSTAGLAVRYRCSACRTTERRMRVQRAIDILGRRCVRCGIIEPLHLDHINDGATARNKTASGNYRRVYSAEQREITIIINTGRSDRLQMLCPNCNYLKHHNRAEYDRPPTYGPL